MIDELSLRNLVQDFYSCPCGESWIEYKGKMYQTDIGYAFDGVYLILSAIEKEFGVELIPEQFRDRDL